MTKTLVKLIKILAIVYVFLPGSALAGYSKSTEGSFAGSAPESGDYYNACSDYELEDSHAYIECDADAYLYYQGYDEGSADCSSWATISDVRDVYTWQGPGTPPGGTAYADYSSSGCAYVEVSVDVYWSGLGEAYVGGEGYAKASISMPCTDDREGWAKAGVKPFIWESWHDGEAPPDGDEYYSTGWGQSMRWCTWQVSVEGEEMEIEPGQTTIVQGDSELSCEASMEYEYWAYGGRVYADIFTYGTATVDYSINRKIKDDGVWKPIATNDGTLICRIDGITIEPVVDIGHTFARPEITTFLPNTNTTTEGEVD